MDLSIVIPTFNEKDNVVTISHRIMKAMENTGSEYEILFVDDSKDETPQVLDNLSKLHPQIHYIHRKNGRGLGTAVVEGFNKSTGNHIIVMDADLQHPPELLPLIFQRLQEGTDLIIPSRFVDGGSDGGLNAFRKLVSWTARMIGRVSIKRMRNITDCTGGFFGLKRDVLIDANLDPIGWKILMEVLVKGNHKTVHEIPYSFVSRDAGESKMSGKEQFNYLRHIMKLIWSSEEDRKFYLFCLIGFSGVFVNLFALYIMIDVLNLGHLRSSVIASLIAMVSNFVLNDTLTWRNINKGLYRLVPKITKFVLVSSIGIIITAIFAQFASWININIMFGQMVGIVVATFWNFKINNIWTWSDKEEVLTKKYKEIVVSQESVQLSNNAS
ncbi:hypothetical protein QW71_27965 [Paenibacillus sp. IHB B 3415]|uniref:glycosyltransferase n=1 Tax=Paenibacillus sp. IHB B 3415 TaxID=867080 RepID=UPI000574FB77|nr:glycosyltransferase family 2 protein [Paenibacillus sp. IHB B 3415]KHL92665.1 hypothetical protein QW71_27965 [Paenibacillus sp. IHB B 3415]